MTFKTRFAPSPTGPLHLGHAYSAILAHDAARAAGGAFYLRLDDIDQSRARAQWAEQIQQDLHWLGLSWDGPVWQQSTRSERYQQALAQLWALGLLYPCSCTRADIRDAANAPQEGAPIIGPDGTVYPGTCRTRPTGPIPAQSTLRLNMKHALEAHDITSISFLDRGNQHSRSAQDMVTSIGDVVLSRRDMPAAYHLAIIVDDYDQQITDVIRGEDLREATFIHVLLQQLLGYPTPHYNHHRLIRDAAGKRLAKRDDARAIAKYRQYGLSPNDIRQMIDLPVSSL